MTTQIKPLVLGVIPARGGSKGVKRKNLRLVAGKPLIFYSIEAARESKLLTDFVTTTDDKEIAAYAREIGSPVIMRPEQIAEDATPMPPVVQHTISTMTQAGAQPDYIVLLQPTAPLRNSDDIDNAISLLMTKNADSVLSVYQVHDNHPSRMYTMDENGILSPFCQEPQSMLRQELPPVYHRNGAIYACHCNLIIQHNTLVGKKPTAYVMPKERSINIDDEIDLLFASFCILNGAFA